MNGWFIDYEIANNKRQVIKAVLPVVFQQDVIAGNGILGTIKTNASVNVNQTGFAADQYVVGSNITIPVKSLRVGMKYRLIFDMTKTAAGTATPVLTLRIGTAGSTADAAILTFTFAAGTAAVDSGLVEVEGHFAVIGSSAIFVGTASISHALAATGLTSTGASGFGVIMVTSSAFDATVENLIIGASFNGGASFAGTLVSAESMLMPI